MIKIDLNQTQILVDGNSLTVWEGTNLSDKLSVLLPGAVTLNFGVSGQTTTSMLTDQATEVLASLDPGKKHKIIVALEGGNDIDGNGLSGLAAHNNYKQYCLNARQAGCLVVACSIFDRNRLPSTPAYVAARGRMRDFNALMRLQWAGYANSFVDSAKIQPAVFDNAENLGFWPDGVHYDPVTYNRFAAYVAEAIRRLVI
jgi:lysophospholipase L1-like esterase